jgi:hypothetical protein
VVVIRAQETFRSTTARKDDLVNDFVNARPKGQPSGIGA